MFKQIYAQYLDGIENFYRCSKTGILVPHEASKTNMRYFIAVYPLVYVYIYNDIR